MVAARDYEEGEPMGANNLTLQIRRATQLLQPRPELLVVVGRRRVWSRHLDV
jgi:hypothetical protein